MSLDKPAASPGLHVILGDSAAGTFRQAFDVSERLLVDQDVLSCGPTPRCDALEGWSACRRDFWRNLIPDMIEEHRASPRNFVEHAAELREAEHITVWAATGVSEQLYVAFLCSLSASMNISPERIDLVQFENLAGRRARVMGMGELNQNGMRNHPPASPLTQQILSDYVAAWNALTSPDPRSIESFAENHAGANRWLKEAMQLMLRRFPDRRSGLSYWDFRLLANARQHGRKATRIFGETMTEDWDDGDLVGDWYLFGRLLRMGSTHLPKPLLTLDGDRRDMRSTEVTLTPFGIDVLEGRASNHPVNPIDDWAAGVRLSSADQALWMRDGDRLVRGEI